MKKVVAFILALLYLTTSMGATIHLHYCMGRLAGWGLIDHSSKDCSFCGMQKKVAPKGCTATRKNCCRDEHRQVKNSGDQKAGTSFSELTFIGPLVANLPSYGYSDALLDAAFLTRPVANGPPETGSVPVFLRYRNFRI